MTSHRFQWRPGDVVSADPEQAEEQARLLRPHPLITKLAMPVPPAIPVAHYHIVSRRPGQPIGPDYVPLIAAALSDVAYMLADLQDALVDGGHEIRLDGEAEGFYASKDDSDPGWLVEVQTCLKPECVE